MIQPLRTVHRWVFVGLAVLLPAVIITSVAARHQYVQRGLVRVDAKNPLSIESWRGVFRGFRGEGTFELKAVNDAPHPELLVYWAQGQSSDSLPVDARLLGTYADGQSYELPLSATGAVVVYSPTQNSVVDLIPMGRPR